MQKSVYITGIAGLIGSSLARHFLLKDWYVSGCDSLIGGYEDNVPNAITWEKTDIDKLYTLVSFGQRTPYDVIIHTAALAYEGASVFSPSLITDSIYYNTIKMAVLAINNKCPLFINCSSMARYGNILAPFEESDEPNPVDPYGLAKLQAEQQLKLLEAIYPSFKSYTVVPHNVSGAHQVYNDPYRNVISIMIHQAMRNLPIYVYGDGSQKRSFSHVDDCVNAINNLIELQPSEKLFNIGPSGNEISILDLAIKIKQKLNSSSEIKSVEARPCEVKDAYCSSELSEKVLSYKTTKSLDDIIDDIVQFIKINGFKQFNYDKFGYEFEISDTIKKPPITWTDKLFGHTRINIG